MAKVNWKEELDEDEELLEEEDEAPKDIEDELDEDEKYLKRPGKKIGVSFKPKAKEIEKPVPKQTSKPEKQKTGYEAFMIPERKGIIEVETGDTIEGQTFEQVMLQTQAVIINELKEIREILGNITER